MDILYSFPLNEGTPQLQENGWSLAKMLGQFFLLIVILILFLFLFSYLSRFINSAKYKGVNSSNLKIIETIALGYQSSLQLVEVGNKVVLIAVTKDRVTFICEVDPDSITKNTNDVKFEVPNTFKKYLDEFINKKNKKDE